MSFSHFEAVNKVVRRELLRELWNALWGKKTMFLPSPKSGGFVLDNAMTTCTKATASPWFCAGWSLHAHFALSIKQNLSLRDSKYNAEIVHVFFVLSFLKFHAHSQICTSSLWQLLFFATPMFILTVAVVCAIDYWPEHFSSAQIPARCARAGKRAPITTAADNIHKYMYFFIVFQRK